MKKLRFSLKLALLTFAIVAFALVLGVKHWKVASSQREYNLAMERWILGTVTLEDVILSSERLTLPEAAAIGTSKQHAIMSHHKRMAELFEQSDFRAKHHYGPGAYERYEERRKIARDRVESFVP